MGTNHYLVVSDLHLCDVEDHADGWKRHKSSRWVYDHELDAMVASFEARLVPGDTFTFILNGDIFDFDLVTAIPADPPWPVGPLEHQYGLDATPDKSVWKLECILRDHPGFVELLARLLRVGHRVVLTIGNHDRELWFDEVSAVLRRAVEAACASARPSGVALGELVIEPWFFHVPGEIYVEHGHQYDYYTSFRYNLEPVVERGGERHIALSPGNLSNRFLLSNIGFFNPHATDYILSVYGYIKHWLEHYAFSRRSLVVTWLVGSVRALFALLATRARLERSPPRDYHRHVHAAADRYGLAPETASALYALRKQPITNRIYKLIREYWIDRVVIATAMVGGTIVLSLSGAALWVKLVVPLVVFPLAWFVYQWAAGNDNVLTTEFRAHTFAAQIGRIVPVRAIVFGHTHVANLVPLARDVTFANSGTWAPIWEREHVDVPAAGLRNYALVRVAQDGRRRLDGPAHDAIEGVRYLTACEVEVGAWLPLSPR
ncbi:MAG: metallophosphoesterase [Deltaproteobacteria bacterium]|nr:metallophosphoesterase [Deltaproteobacteria bacterium]